MTSSWRRRRDRAGLAVGATLLVLAGAGSVLDGGRAGFTEAGAVAPGPVAAPAAAATARDRSPATSSPADPAGRPAGVDPAPRRTGLAAGGIRPDASFEPDRVRVPALGVDAPVVGETVDGRGALSLPDDPHTVGWWAAGAAPGAPVGTVVLAGHVDSERQGAGALFALAHTPVGARVVVSGPRGDATYVVQGRRRYDKRDLPWRALFGQDVEARLLLVTCGGDFDRATRHYTDNVVVYAVPVGAATPPSR
jgi:hypothetical protein